MSEIKHRLQVPRSYFDIVLKFHEIMVEEKILLMYEGEVNQQITKVFSALAEKNMDNSNENISIKRKVRHVMVECLQNIVKHADNIDTGLNTTDSGHGIFMVVRDNNEYAITSGNAIGNEKVERMKKALNEINAMDKYEIKAMYKKQMREGKISEKGGAGLGFIDMAKKTGNKLDYHFEPLNNKTTFFILKAIITRKND